VVAGLGGEGSECKLAHGVPSSLGER
jgi:hypothetical protein